MLPIHALLNRIRWDREFGKGDFRICYFDRIESRVVVIPFDELRLDPEAPGEFEIVDDEGHHHFIPLHRIREVYKNGQLIWQRPAPR